MKLNFALAVRTLNTAFIIGYHESEAYARVSLISLSEFIQLNCVYNPFRRFVDDKVKSVFAYAICLDEGWEVNMLS